MANFAIILLSFFTFISFTQGQNVNVSVFYEALCPDSVRFFTMQLKYAYPLIGDRISIDFVPYGKANHFKRDGKWHFRCHHGHNECYANQIQACAIHQNATEKSKVNFLICLMSSSRFNLVNPTHIEKCANESSLSAPQIYSCMRGELKDTLLAQHGDKTLSLDPIITFVPTIIFNNKYDPWLQNDALENLLATVCNQLSPRPTDCPAQQSFMAWFR